MPGTDPALLSAEDMLTEFARRRLTPVDVLQAPHHGGRTANPPALAAWCRPKLVVSCEGPPQWPSQVREVYEGKGAKYLGTYPHGAVTLHSHRTGLVAETYRTGQRFVLRRGG